MIKNVKSAETPFLADLFAISFRWLILFGLVVFLSINGKLDWLNLAVISTAALWNVFVTTIASVNRRLPFHRQINIFADILCTVLIFAMSGGVTSPVLWVGALSVASASIYYLLPGALLIAVLISLLETGFVYLETGGHFDMLFLAMMVGVNLAAGVIAGLLSNPLIRRLRISYQSILHRRREAEMRVQRAERERMKAIFQITEAMSGTFNYQAVLDTALDVSQEALSTSPVEAKDLLTAFLLFNDGILKISSGRGFPPADLLATLHAESGALYEMLHTGNPRLINNPASDSELVRLIAIQNTKAAYCLPLIRGLNAFGVMLVAHPNPAFFTQDRCDMLEIVCNQSVIAIENARLFKELNLDKERMVNSQEEAQKKLARDLHDGPTQSISAIAMRLNIIHKLMEKNPAEATAEIKKVEDMARRTVQEIRHMLFTLRPLILETEGLTAALKAMADKMFELYQQKVSIEISADVVADLEQNKQTVIFNLAEEAVNNARKHAEASEVRVLLSYLKLQPKIALFEVIDNGKGFDVKEVLGSYERRGSLGMINLRERSEMINGLLKIDSEPGKGTRIRVFIPLDQNAIDQLHKLAQPVARPN